MDESRSYEVAFVLFMDIVSYSLQTVDRQAKLLSLLQSAVKRSPEFQRARSNKGELIVLPTGDGMLLAFTRNPVSPMHYALEISESIRGSADLKLRTGIHTGPITH